MAPASSSTACTSSPTVRWKGRSGAGGVGEQVEQVRHLVGVRAAVPLVHREHDDHADLLIRSRTDI